MYRDIDYIEGADGQKNLHVPIISNLSKISYIRPRAELTYFSCVCNILLGLPDYHFLSKRGHVFPFLKSFTYYFYC